MRRHFRWKLSCFLARDENYSEKIAPTKKGVFGCSLLNKHAKQIFSLAWKRTLWYPSYLSIRTHFFVCNKGCYSFVSLFLYIPVSSLSYGLGRCSWQNSSAKKVMAEITECFPVAEIIRCSNFAAVKHKYQRRKDPEKTPYINHPIGLFSKNNYGFSLQTLLEDNVCASNFRSITWRVAVAHC